MRVCVRADVCVYMHINVHVQFMTVCDMHDTNNCVNVEDQKAGSLLMSNRVCHGTRSLCHSHTHNHACTHLHMPPLGYTHANQCKWSRKRAKTVHSVSQFQHGN